MLQPHIKGLMLQSSIKNTKKINIASIDVGLKRIGLALYLENILMPIEAVIRKNRNQASNDVLAILSQYNIHTLVVGIPQDEDKNNMQKRIKHFIELVDFQGDIKYQNEDFSSFEAKELSKGIFRHKKDGRIDSLSAYIILERFIFASNIKPNRG